MRPANLADEFTHLFPFGVTTEADTRDVIPLSGDKQVFIGIRKVLPGLRRVRGDLSGQVAVYMVVVVSAALATASALIDSAVPYGDLPAVVGLADSSIK